MPSSARSTVMLWAASLLLAGRIATSPALAQEPKAGRDCSGTFCDLYYDHFASTPPTPPPANGQPAPKPGFFDGLFSRGPAPQAATGQAAPAAAAPASPQPYVRVGGGGLIGMARGAPDQRCTGTLCDLYYGGSPPEQPAAQSAAAPLAAPEATPTRTRTRPAADDDTVVRREKPRCAASAGDPWSCYR